MHEISLAQSVVDIIAEQQRTHGFVQVTAVRLEIGALSHTEPEALRFCFDAVARGTVAEGAQLEFERPTGRGRCLDCSHDAEVSALYDPCPRCGSFRVELTGGREMRIKDLTVENVDRRPT